MSIVAERIRVAAPENPNAFLLSDISLELKDGQLYLLVGETGSGKTTLLTTLACLLPPTAGTLRFEGVPVWRKGKPHPSALAATGIVFQQPEAQFFGGTVDKELTYSLRPLRLQASETARRKTEALADVGLSEAFLPRPTATLSGGQKRRVGLASTLVTHPVWLFLDEPTAGLDPLGIRQLRDQLETLRAERAKRGGIVVATHDVDALLPVADQVIVLQSGQLVGVFTPEELYDQPDILREAGVGVPESVALFEVLQSHGINAARLPRTVDEAVDLILRHVEGGAVQSRGKGEYRAAQASSQSLDGVRAEDSRLSKDSDPESCLGLAEGTPLQYCSGQAGTASRQLCAAARSEHPEVAPHSERESGLRRGRDVLQKLDVRAKWISYLLWSVAVLLQSDWYGVAACTVLVATLIRWCGLGLGEFRVVRPFLNVAALSVAVSGLQFGQSGAGPGVGSVHYSMDSGLTTLFSLSRIFLVVLLSVVLTATTSTFQMKQGLDSIWPRRWKRPLAWDAFTLGAALTLRFIPVVSREWQRFSLIVRARAKSTTRPGTVRLRDLPAVAIPMLLSCLQTGDALADALEARGYHRLGMQRTNHLGGKLGKSDVAAIVVSVITFATLFGFRFW
jgi:energy-coupling factor transporter ATP-binding protein EcfA2/energy-coupling factor transporter transmembrane protein EcfT